MLNEILLYSSIGIMSVAILIFIYYSFFSKLFKTEDGKNDPVLASRFGEFINGITGPLFALAGFLIVYSTIIEQNQTNQLQKFESIYFNLLDFHRSNNAKMRIPHSPISGEEKIGESAFINFKQQLNKAYSTISKFDKSDNRITKEDKINISFLIFYIGNSSSQILPKSLNKYKTELDYNQLVDSLNNIKHTSSLKRYFDGNKGKLSSYFGQFFDVVSYVDSQTFINDESKRFYIDLLKSQNSLYVEALIYWYSLSDLISERDRQLVSKYELFEKLDESMFPWNEVTEEINE